MLFPFVMLLRMMAGIPSALRYGHAGLGPTDVGLFRCSILKVTLLRYHVLHDETLE